MVGCGWPIKNHSLAPLLILRFSAALCSAGGWCAALVCPIAIAFQNGHRSARCKTGGVLGNRSLGHRDRLNLDVFCYINTAVWDVLRRWVESTQYVSMRTSAWRAEAGVDPLVASKGDSDDNGKRSGHGPGSQAAPVPPCSCGTAATRCPWWTRACRCCATGRASPRAAGRCPSRACAACFCRWPILGSGCRPR